MIDDSRGERSFDDSEKKKRERERKIAKIKNTNVENGIEQNINI